MYVLFSVQANSNVNVLIIEICSHSLAASIILINFLSTVSILCLNETNVFNSFELPEVTLSVLPLSS